MTATAKVAACDMSYEEVFDALTAFHRRPGFALREVVMRPMLGGVYVKLIEGTQTYEGRGKRAEDAIANALEALEESEQ